MGCGLWAVGCGCWDDGTEGAQETGSRAFWCALRAMTRASSPVWLTGWTDRAPVARRRRQARNGVVARESRRDLSQVWYVVRLLAIPNASFGRRCSTGTGAGEKMSGVERREHEAIDWIDRSMWPAGRRLRHLGVYILIGPPRCSLLLLSSVLWWIPSWPLYDPSQLHHTEPHRAHRTVGGPPSRPDAARTTPRHLRRRANNHGCTASNAFTKPGQTMPDGLPPSWQLLHQEQIPEPARI